MATETTTEDEDQAVDHILVVEYLADGSKKVMQAGFRQEWITAEDEYGGSIRMSTSLMSSHMLVSYTGPDDVTVWARADVKDLVVSVADRLHEIHKERAS